MNASVKDVMTTQTVWVEHDTPFAAIAASLRQFRVSAFPVLDDDGHVIGVVSESDLLAKLALEGGEGRMPGMITGILHQHEMEKARGITAEDLMTSPAATVSPDDTVEHAARLMYVRRVKRLPVIDEDNRLAGIVSRADVLSVYGRADAEIGEEIRNDIATCEYTADVERFDVAVTDGVVTLSGQVPSAYDAMLVYRAAQQTPGVREISDKLEFVVPNADTRNPLIDKGRPDDVEPYLQAQIRRQVGDLAHVDRVRMQGDGLVVTGTLGREEDRPRVEAILRSMPVLRGFHLQQEFTLE
jgi:CBS domain-containing protein